MEQLWLFVPYKMEIAGTWLRKRPCLEMAENELVIEKLTQGDLRTGW